MSKRMLREQMISLSWKTYLSIGRILKSIKDLFESCCLATLFLNCFPYDAICLQRANRF